MIPHEVIRIIDKPQRMKWKMDHVTIDYWSVPVILRNSNNEQHESAVTFETLEEALKLREGDVFLR